MTVESIEGAIQVGTDLPGLRRVMTRERMRWYADALATTSEVGDQMKLAGANIHTDDDFAHSQGLSGIIADGMISTNWISTVLLDCFGSYYLRGGSLKTKYIRPIYEDETILVKARIADLSRGDGTAIYTVDVRCETDQGDLCTVGEAWIPVPLDATDSKKATENTDA